VVIWKSHVQKLKAALSSSEAEYYAACDLTKTVICAIDLLQEIGWTISEPVKFQIDNQSAIQMGGDSSSQKRTKHIRVKEQFVNDAHDGGDITLEWLPTGDNPADMFTKPLDNQLFFKHRGTIMGTEDNDQYWLSNPLSQAPAVKKRKKPRQNKPSAKTPPEPKSKEQ
jgi:hypothetical protein